MLGRKLKVDGPENHVLYNVESCKRIYRLCRPMSMFNQFNRVRYSTRSVQGTRAGPDARLKYYASFINTRHPTII